MSREIKFDEETRSELKSKLDNVNNTLDKSLNDLSNLVDRISAMPNNPELQNIVTQVSNVKDNKQISRRNVTELRHKMDLNLEKLKDLDSEISEKFKGW